MEKQSGMSLNATDHIRTERRSGSECKNYTLLNANTNSGNWQAGEPRLVAFVIPKQASYELALETAFDVFKVPEDKRQNVRLKCRLKGSPEGTCWIYIQPAVWNEIMEFFLSGPFRTDLWP